MKNEQKKKSVAGRVVGALFPFKKPAAQALRPAVDGLELARDALSRIKADLNPTPRAGTSAPQGFADAQALWRESAQRHGLDAQRIATILAALDNSWFALFFTGAAAAALGLAGFILIFIDSPSVQNIGMASSCCPALLATGLLLRVNMRRSQVRARALVSWPQFRKAAGGVLPAIFGDVKLSAENVDGGK